MSGADKTGGFLSFPEWNVESALDDVLLSRGQFSCSARLESDEVKSLGESVEVHEVGGAGERILLLSNDSSTAHGGVLLNLGLNNLLLSSNDVLLLSLDDVSLVSFSQLTLQTCFLR